MSPRDAVRGLAIGRIVLGVSLLLFPRLVGRLSIGPDADSAAVTVLSRALGARDAVVGGMMLHTLQNPQVAQRWIKTSAALDAVDCTAAFLARDGLPPSRRALFYALAGGSAVAHTVLAPRLPGDAIAST